MYPEEVKLAAIRRMMASRWCPGCTKSDLFCTSYCFCGRKHADGRVEEMDNADVRTGPQVAAAH